jgi:hypothetical protein
MKVGVAIGWPPETPWTKVVGWPPVTETPGMQVGVAVGCHPVSETPWMNLEVVPPLPPANKVVAMPSAE